MKKKRVRIGTLIFFIVATAFVTAMATYYYLSFVVENLGQNQQLYSKLNYVNKSVTNSYIGNISAIDGYQKMTDGAVAGYIDGISDPYSYYLDEHNNTVSFYVPENFVDIGIVSDYDYKNKGIKVSFIKNDSPAMLSELEVGDVILQIDGTSVLEQGYKNSLQKLKGEEQSQVSLFVYREKTDENLEINLVRTAYTPNTVSSKMIDEEKNIGYILINEFDSTTFKSFSSAFSSLKEKGAKGIIIDVRYCYSGDIESVAAVLNLLTPTASVLFSVNEKTSENPIIYNSEGKTVGVPIVVIQNAETSGVAEVFSGSLRDTASAVVIGEVSAGYGLGQKDILLGDGSALHLSTEEYILPSGESFNKTGVSPAFESVLSPEKKEVFSTLTDEEDDQLQFALVKIKEQIG